ncbi:MAG: 2-hydroxyacyl-CoA dehydratase family protein [Candidatus Helarchaeota archaeon]
MIDIKLDELVSTLKSLNKPVVGIFPHMMIPLELIYATNKCHPFTLCLGGNDDMANIGTEYLTQATCPFARGTIGFFNSGTPLYSITTHIVGGNYCNGDLTATEMIYIYFDKIHIPFVFPTTARPPAQKFYYKELESFKTKLEDLFNVNISNDDIYDAIDKYNKMRGLLRNINEKKINNSIINHVELQNLIYKAMICGPDIIIPELENILNNSTTNNNNNKKRILLTGSLIALGDDFLQTLYESDIDIVINDTEFGLCFYEKDIEKKHDDPLKDLTDYYLTNTIAGRMYPNNTTIPRAITFFKKYNLDGVINHVLKFCDPYVALKSIFKIKMQDENIPTLELERDYSTNIGQLKTRIEAFLEMI